MITELSHTGERQAAVQQAFCWCRSGQRWLWGLHQQGNLLIPWAASLVYNVLAMAEAQQPEGLNAEVMLWESPLEAEPIICFFRSLNDFVGHFIAGLIRPMKNCNGGCNTHGQCPADTTQ